MEILGVELRNCRKRRFANSIMSTYPGILSFLRSLWDPSRIGIQAQLRDIHRFCGVKYTCTNYIFLPQSVNCHSRSMCKWAEEDMKPLHIYQPDKSLDVMSLLIGLFPDFLESLAKSTNSKPSHKWMELHF